MSSRVYSTRFLLITTHVTWIGFTVPAGRRASIKSVVVMTDMVNQGAYQLAIGTRLVMSLLVPGQSGTRIENPTIVAYEGESVQGYISLPGTTLCVSGHLYDTQGAVQRRSSAAARDAAT